jgi:alpha-L-fucosidase
MAVPTPGEVLKIKSLGTAANLLDKPIKSIQLLGGPAIDYLLNADALHITCPAAMPFQHAVGFRIAF